jgi:hypothetical protein
MAHLAYHYMKLKKYYPDGKYDKFLDNMENIIDSKK